MARVCITDVLAHPTAFLDGTRVTLDECQQLVPPFEVAFHAPLAIWPARLSGLARRDAPAPPQRTAGANAPAHPAAGADAN